MQAFDLSRTVKHGFTALKRATVPLLVGAFIIDFLTGRFGSNNYSGGSDYGGSDTDPQWDPNPPTFDTGSIRTPTGFEGLELPTVFGEADTFAIAAVVLGGLVCAGLFLLVLLVARCFMLTGWYRLHEECLLDGTGTFTALFSGADRLRSMVGLKLIEGLIQGSIAVVALALAGLAAFVAIPIMGESFAAFAGLAILAAFWFPVAAFLSLRLFAADRLLALEAMGPIEALKGSWQLTSGRLPEILIFFIGLILIQILVTLASCCLCCFSFVITVPLRAVMDTAVTEAVLVAARGDSATEEWSAFE